MSRPVRRSPRRSPKAAHAAVAAAALALTVALGLLPVPTPAGAQEGATTTTSSTSTSTTSTSTTSTTVPGPAPTVAPPAESTTTTAPPPPPPPPPDGQPHDDAASDEVPTDPVVVPPPAEPLPPDPTAPVLQEVAAAAVTDLGSQLDLAASAAQAAAKEVRILTAEVEALESRLAQLQGEEQLAVTRLDDARQRLKRRAVASYIGSPAAPVNQVLDAVDFNDLSRRFELLGAVMEADRNRVEEYQLAKAAVGTELQVVVETLDRSRSALSVALAVQSGADASLVAKQVQFAATRTGGDIVGAGFVFPVGGANSFTDTFNAPRMFGTAYAHLHQGTDIFAASGTPLLACERGVLIRMGTDRLGGTKLWLVGASGTRYYYAHLSAFAPDAHEGKVVNAGDVIGFVGNTGNAITTPAHLHFEVHPGGGPAINPYPMLRIVADAEKRAAAGAAR